MDGMGWMEGWNFSLLLWLFWLKKCTRSTQEKEKSKKREKTVFSARKTENVVLDVFKTASMVATTKTTTTM
jgi:hypothetical protein